MSNDNSNISEFYYFEYKMTVYDNLFAGIVYGVYIVLYVTSVHILMFMFGITTLMFALAIVALVLRAALGFQVMQAFLGFTSAHTWSEDRFHVVSLVEATITRLMYILSDIVCAWRAIVLWNRDKRIIAILLLLILGTTAAAGCELRLGISVIPSGNRSFQGDRGPLIMVGPTLATNLVSTGSITWKAWEHRVSVRKHLGEANRCVRTERVFALLVESGFIYCCVWIVYLISALDLIPVPGFAVMDNVLVFVSGLYPTLIIILVAMQKSPVQYYSTHSTGMQFTREAAPEPLRAGDMPPYVYTIFRENANDYNKRVHSVMETSDEDKSL
ncbi:hypothetical protein EDB92DRAFT_2105738 [Lactarius akahatsu]|uniref:Uncharacterized protein n=1 Tax=Lactarius akahatsu TaxID=416441 RepID=A0AAD4L907_9AGAM|nr:hypothetical protein EDB92DRAFT_2105738 [Lactarius akahatsu]